MNKPTIHPEIRALCNRLARHVMSIARERNDKDLAMRFLTRLQQVPVDGDLKQILRGISTAWEDECLGEWPSDCPGPAGEPANALMN
jgi:hypothetical protein